MSRFEYNINPANNLLARVNLDKIYSLGELPEGFSRGSFAGVDLWSNPISRFSLDSWDEVFKKVEYEASKRYTVVVELIQKTIDTKIEQIEEFKRTCEHVSDMCVKAREKAENIRAMGMKKDYCEKFLERDLDRVLVFCENFSDDEKEVERLAHIVWKYRYHEE